MIVSDAFIKKQKQAHQIVNYANSVTDNGEVLYKAAKELIYLCLLKEDREYRCEKLENLISELVRGVYLDIPLDDVNLPQLYARIGDNSITDAIFEYPESDRVWESERIANDIVGSIKNCVKWVNREDVK